MIDRIHSKLESVQIPAGYTVAAGLGTTPIWVQDISNWLEFGALVFAVAIGATTLWLNVLKIIKERK
jgi:hypothetical protein